MNIIDKMQKEGLPEQEILRELDEAHREDWHFAEGKILYSMCNEPTPLSSKAHMMFLESNLGDPNLYPGTQALERSVVNMLLSILNGNTAMGGGVLAGGSEANITALWIYRNLTNKRQVILSETSHYSFEIAADMLGMDLTYVPTDKEYRMDINILEKMIRKKDTAVVVGVAGTTEHGQIDPIDRIEKICRDKEVFLHVDAAFGGMVFPFLTGLGFTIPSAYDFSLGGVSSITVDPHKMGQATLPAGALLIRDPQWYQHIAHRATYLSQEVFSSILGTRCSASVASAYAVMRHYGVQGYQQLLKGCMQNVAWFVQTAKGMGFKFAIEPMSPVICIPFNDEKITKEVQQRLLEAGWRVSRTVRPHGIRLVLMPHVHQDRLIRFLPTLHRICKSMDLI